MRQLSRTDAPALRALAALCLSDPSNPANPGYGVTAEDVARFMYVGRPLIQVDEAEDHLAALERDGYVRRNDRGFRRVAWTPTARGWQAALMPSETVDERA